MFNHPSKRSSRLALTLLVLLSLIAAACGDDSETTTDEPAAETPTLETPVNDAPAANDEMLTGDLEGEFLVSGSSTVYPIVQKQAEEFTAVNSGVALAVEGPGSGDGAQKFCAGEVPIANASRLFKDEEIEICEANGIEFIEIRRGIDGISVVTSADNDAIECVSFNDLYALISEEAFGSDNWADANTITADWGGTVFPDAALDIFAPGQESGTYDSFAEIVLESVAKGKTGLEVDDRAFEDTIRPDYTASSNDNIIIEGIASSQYSLGWVGYAFAAEAADAGDAKLLQVSKEDGGDCVSPTPETIADASFPIARYLYTYVNVEAAATEPAVTAFVDYMMSEAGLESVTAVGYVALADADQDLAQSIWENRSTGRSWG
ncbi:MAG: phosphate transport system substrate-binding protein [Candidatus Aldehydirespiratoraceae bacterium]|jgi:phosphate transport system substrate-binding protein